MTSTLAVVGAINVDLVVSGAALPRPGETVVGGTFARHQGGKGANQAVAAARALGGAGRVAMIGAVGSDDHGQAAREALAHDGVDVGAVHVSAEPTGVALITVDPTGENQISVAPGANADLSADHIVGALESFDDVELVLASLEVPFDAVAAAAGWCTEHVVRLVLNPAPASAEARQLLDAASVVTPNTGELAMLAGGPSDDDPRISARTVADARPGLTVVTTLGAGGCLIASPDGRDEHSPAFEVHAVDTTGAGDCFSGVLASGLLEGRSVSDAARRAAAAAALATTAPGARGGMPTREQLDAFLAQV